MKLNLKNNLTRILLKFSLILFICLAINSNSLQLKIKSSIIDNSQIPFCNSLTEQKLGYGGEIHSKYLQSNNKDKCIGHKDLFAYTTDFYKVINCYLRTNLKDKINIPNYVTESISNISNSLSGASDTTIKNLKKNEVVKRFSLISQSSNLTVNSFWKNLSFLSTSHDSSLNQTTRNGFNTPQSYLLIFVPKQDKKLDGKKIKFCSDNPGEKEFLLDKEQCWKVTNIYKNTHVNNPNKNNKEITFTSVDCDNSQTYNDL